MVLGTPGYIAPEQVTDPTTIGPSWDIYAVGAVGYYLLTGRTVFQGRTAAHVIAQHISDLPKRPSEVAAVHVDAQLEAIVMACLAKSPAARPQSTAAIATQLRALPVSSITDWSEAEARVWWADYRAALAVVVTTPNEHSRTITVDLEHRA
jgi:serine/threonine protein kinase